PVDPLLGLDLAPGQSFSYVFGTLTPIGGAAPVGVYPADPNATLSLELLSGAVTAEVSLNTFVVRVPEPSGSALLGAGLLPLILWSRVAGRPRMAGSSTRQISRSQGAAQGVV